MSPSRDAGALHGGKATGDFINDLAGETPRRGLARELLDETACAP